MRKHACKQEWNSKPYLLNLIDLGGEKKGKERNKERKASVNGWTAMRCSMSQARGKNINFTEHTVKHEYRKVHIEILSSWVKWKQGLCSRLPPRALLKYAPVCLPAGLLEVQTLLPGLCTGQRPTCCKAGPLAFPTLLLNVTDAQIFTCGDSRASTRVKANPAVPTEQLSFC